MKSDDDYKNKVTVRYVNRKESSYSKNQTEISEDFWLSEL